MSEVGPEETNEELKTEETQAEVEIEVEAEAEVEVIEEKKDDFKEKYFYLAAEMDNLRKRFDREKENLLKYGSEKIMTSLVEVVDNLDRTIDALKSDEDEKIVNIVKGVDMVRDQFLNVLKQNGLERVEALGEIFDPNFHEAMAQQPAEGKKDQEVILEYQKGYVLNGRLVRAAKVVIAQND